MCNKTTVGSAFLLLSFVCFGAACGAGASTNASVANANVVNAIEANVSVAAANTNSGETMPKQTDSSPVMIKANQLIEEYQADPKKTYDKYRDRTMSVTGALESVSKGLGSNGYKVQLQDSSGKTKLVCYTTVDSETAAIYEKVGKKLDGLGEAGRMRNAPNATVTGLYESSHSSGYEPKIDSFALMPCKLTDFAK